jgi:uncharacterized protein (DUF1800 family)
MSRFFCVPALAAAALAAAAAAFAAPTDAPAAASMARAPAGNAVPLSEAEKARMALDRLAFGARPGEVERVRAMGVDAWIERQLHPERIPDAGVEKRVAGLDVPKSSTAQLFEKYPNPAMILAREGMRRKDAQAGEDKDALKRQLVKEYLDKGYGRPREVYTQLGADRLLRATYSERQLQEVMVDFWSNHFNVYAKKNVLQWYLPSYDREVIRPHALGKFRDLLLATAQSPAMLYYLDNFQSVSPNARLAEKLPGRRNGERKKKLPEGLNENYARELMELHTLGVDGGYTQADVREVARAFTGWTIADARGMGSARAMGGRGGARMRARVGVPAGVQAGEFYFNPVLHDSGTKTVLGQRIAAGGVRDGQAVIDLLARHPSTAKFIARKLCEKFASDDPDPALVARVAAAFTRSDGDIRATLSSLFRDPAFFTARNYRAKVKTPFELVASSLRALDAQSDGRAVQLLLSDMGEPLYGWQAPTGYSELAADWVNSGALLKRMNFAVALASNRIPGTHVDLAALGGRDGDARVQLDAALQALLGGQVSAATRKELLARLDQPLPAAQLDAAMTDATMDSDYGGRGTGGGRGRGQRLRLLAASGDPQRVQVAALVLGSPEFQRQ